MNEEGGNVFTPDQEDDLAGFVAYWAPDFKADEDINGGDFVEAFGHLLRRSGLVNVTGQNDEGGLIS